MRKNHNNKNWQKYIKIPKVTTFGILAADEGFEPSQTESESGVLPLHKSAKRISYYSEIFRNVNP